MLAATGFAAACTDVQLPRNSHTQEVNKSIYNVQLRTGEARLP